MTDHLEKWMQELIELHDAETEKMTDKQKQILSAAIEVFSEKGYAGSSTNEIASKAGVAEGTIFRHYKTKKDLLISIVAPMMSKLIAPFALRDLNRVLDKPYDRMEDFFAAFFRNRFEFARQNLPILKILLQEIPFQPELRETFKEIVAKKVFERITRVVMAYQHKGQIINIPPITVIRLAMSTMMGYVLTRFLIAPEAEWDDEAEIEHTIQFIMYGLSPVPEQAEPSSDPS